MVEEKEKKELKPKAERDKETGRFLPGGSGNPAGRPVGSISLITEAKKIFRDDPEFLKAFVNAYLKDPSNRKHVVEMVDGRPRQALEHTGDIVLPFIFKVERYEEQDGEPTTRKLTEGDDT